jgi:hypothetical protein
MHAPLRTTFKKSFVCSAFPHSVAALRTQTSKHLDSPTPFEIVRQDTGMADIRVLVTDKTIAQLPTLEDGWYLARDTELKGFLCRHRKAKTDIYSSRRSPTGPKARLIHQSIDRGHF